MTIKVDNMGALQQKDTRNQELLDLDRLLSKFSLERENERVQEVVTRHPEMVTTQAKDALARDAMLQNVRVKFDSIVFGGPLVCDFSKTSFHGGFGGWGIGGGDHWGTAAFNYGVDWLGDQKWKARFLLSAGDAGLIIQFWGMSGEYIGNIMAKGYRGNEVLVGGEGSFFRL